MGSSQTILPYFLTSECKNVKKSAFPGVGWGGGNITNCIATPIQDIASSVFLLGFLITNLIKSHTILLIHQFKFKNGLGWATFFRISKSVAYAGAVFQAELYFSRASLKKKEQQQKRYPAGNKYGAKCTCDELGNRHHTPSFAFRHPSPMEEGYKPVGGVSDCIAGSLLCF